MQVYLCITHASFCNVKILVSASAVYLNRMGARGKDVRGHSMGGKSGVLIPGNKQEPSELSQQETLPEW